MARSHDGEVSAVERYHHAGIESLGQCDDGRVGAAERQVGILVDELGDPLPFVGCWELDLDLAESSQEACLGRPSRLPTR